MKITPVGWSGAWILAATVAVCVAVLFHAPGNVMAADPSSGTLSDANPSLTYTSVFAQENPTDSPPTCSAAANEHCDDFALTINFPSGYVAAHQGGAITITTSWLDPDDDFDLYLVNSSGTYVKTQASAGPSPEVIELLLSELPADQTTFTIRIVLFNKGSGANAGTATTRVAYDAGPTDPCVLPGVRVLLDPLGDAGAPGGDQQDIRSISIAELGEDTDTLALTMKVASLSGTLTPSASWNIFFTGPDGVIHFVSMTTDPSSAASYHYGTRSGTTNTTVGDADSGAYSADGTITVRVATSKVGSPAPGQTLTAVWGRAYVQVATQLLTADSAPNTVPGIASYTLVGNSSCPAPPPETPCVLPGIKVFTDPAADFGPPGEANQDIKFVGVAELGSDTDALTFTMKVDNLAEVPPNGIWRIYFSFGGTAYYVSMESDPSSAVSFSYGTTDGTIDSGLGAADAGSYNAQGFIYIKVAAAKIGNPAAGQKLTAFLGRTFLLVGAAGSGVIQEIDNEDGQAGAKEYERKGNSFCPAPPAGSVCVLPGLAVAIDPPGDFGDPGDSNQDILRLGIAELAADADGLLTFTMQVGDLTSVPPNGIWRIYFSSGGTAYYVSMESDPSSAVSFSYGTTDGTIDSGLGAADSGDYTSDGFINIKLGAGRIGGPTPGDTLTGIFARTYLLVGAAGSGIIQEIDNEDGQTGAKAYTLSGNAFCRNTKPVAALAVDHTTGSLPGNGNFNFTVAGSDAEDGLTGYTLDFGDGNEAEGAFDGVTSLVVAHTYAEAGDYTATLTVTDDHTLPSDPVSVDLVISGPPVAHAGPDQEVNEGVTVTLDGTGSNDGNMGALTYSWTAPAGITLLPGNSSPVVTFNAPDVCPQTPLTFQLTVSNAAGTSSDDVIVKVDNINQNPVADAGGDRTVHRGDDVTLDGRGSSDPDTCQALTYQWEQIAGDTVSHGDVTSPTLAFRAPDTDASQLLYFRLTVTDSEGAKDVDNIVVTVSNVPIGFTKILGGAMPLAGLVPLGLFGILRRRRGSA